MHNSHSAGQDAAPVGPTHDARAQRLRHTLWIGGAPSAGNATMARALASQFGLRLYLQDRMEPAHFARATPERQPEMCAFLRMSLDERWVLRSPAAMAAQVVRSCSERLELIVEDLLALPRDEPTLVEGSWLLPELVGPLLTDPLQAFWLVPTPDFQHAIALQRSNPARWNETSDPERATRNLIERDRLLAEHIRWSAAALLLAVWEVDGGVTPDELLRQAALRVASWLPRAR